MRVILSNVGHGYSVSDPAHANALAAFGFGEPGGLLAEVDMRDVASCLGCSCGRMGFNPFAITTVLEVGASRGVSAVCFIAVKTLSGSVGCYSVVLALVMRLGADGASDDR